jgi:hypothetical protein
VWACPVCAEKILMRRQEEVARALATWTGLAGRIGFVTLTMRHNRGQRLGDLWDALTSAWSSTTSGRPWRDLCARYGVEGWARVVEVTNGKHGWHVHAHVALFLPAGSTSADVEAIGARMFARWSAALVRRGLAAPIASKGGVDAQLWGASDGGRLSDYFTKGDYLHQVDTRKAAMELTRPDYKSGRGGNRTPFQILGDLIDQGDAHDLDLWEEWERSSKGRRMLTWSRGLRDRLVDLEDKTDEELAAEEVGTADDDLVEIPADGLRLLARFGLHGQVLDLAEHDDGGARLCEWLRRRGIPHERVRRKSAAPSFVA